MQSLKAIMAGSTLSGRFTRGVAWAAVGTALSQGVGLMVAILTARMLGKVRYGEFGIIQSTICMYGVLAGLWLGLGATKYVAEFKVDSPARAGRIIGLSFLIAIISSMVVSAIIIVMAPFLAQRVLNAPHLSVELAFMAGIIVLNVLDGVQVGALSGFEAFGAIARTSIIRSIVALPVTIFLVWKWGLGGAVFSLAVTGFLNLWINQRALRIECRQFGVHITWRGIGGDLRGFLNFSAPALLGGVLGAPVLWIANALLVNQPNGYAEMGIYSIANQWKTAVMFLPRKFISVALPMMSAEVNKNTTDSKYQEVFNLTQSLSILMVLPLVTFLMLASHLIIKIYGEKFAGAEVVLIGVLMATGISALGSGVGPAIQANGKMWFGLFTNILWSVILLMFTWIFVPYLGARSLVFGMALAYAVMVLYSIAAMRKDLPKLVLTRTLGCMVLLSSVTIMAVYVNKLYLNILIFPVTVLTAIITLYCLISKSVSDNIIQYAKRLFNE
jgi:O-antigen/teichoic acid export membrane protein